MARNGIAPVAEVGKVQRRHQDFSLKALLKLMMRLLERVRKPCRVYCRRVGSATPRSQQSTPREMSKTDHGSRPARYLRKICVYPLGRVLKRSYDGGLSFSAQMQIDAEGGV